MTIQLHSRGAATVFIGAILLSIVLGAWASKRLNDPRWLERSGSVIAAMAAAAVFFQILTELKIEDERSTLSRQEQEAEEVEGASPLGALQARLIRRRMQMLQDGLVRARLHVAAFVVVGATLGELLHGFGELIVCHLLILCPVPK